MTRFNYLAAGPREYRFHRPEGLAIDNRIRGPLAALTAIVVVCAALVIVQFQRLEAAHSAYLVAAARVNDEPERDRSSVLRLRLQSDVRLAQAVAAARRDSLTHANALAWIGNALPGQTWLHTLRYDHGVYVLEGSAARTDAVGLALLALHDPARGMYPRLVSVRDDGTGGPIRVHYTLRIAAQP